MRYTERDRQTNRHLVAKGLISKLTALYLCSPHIESIVQSVTSTSIGMRTRRTCDKDIWYSFVLRKTKSMFSRINSHCSMVKCKETNAKIELTVNKLCLRTLKYHDTTQISNNLTSRSIY